MDDIHDCVKPAGAFGHRVAVEAERHQDEACSDSQRLGGEEAVAPRCSSHRDDNSADKAHERGHAKR